MDGMKEEEQKEKRAMKALLVLLVTSKTEYVASAREGDRKHMEGGHRLEARECH